MSFLPLFFWEYAHPNGKNSWIKDYSLNYKQEIGSINENIMLCNDRVQYYRTSRVASQVN